MSFQNYDTDPKQADKNLVPPPVTRLQNKRSDSLAAAAFVLGMIALLTSGCIYLSIVCGSLGIILALLSKGGEDTLSRQGKLGLILSICGLVAAIVLFVGMVIFVLHYYGGIDGVMEAYMQIMGIETLEEVYETLGITY